MILPDQDAKNAEGPHIFASKKMSTSRIGIHFHPTKPWIHIRREFYSLKDPGRRIMFKLVTRMPLTGADVVRGISRVTIDLYII